MATNNHAYTRVGALLLLLFPLVLVARGESVRLYRDTYGVPHVFGQSMAGAYYGAGYAVAEDLKWGLSQLALKAEGRQTEFLGRHGNLLNEDIFSRHFHFYKDALEKFPQLSPETQTAFRAYAQGIDARYVELAQVEPRPEWAIDVTAEHLAATFLAANFYQSAYQAKDHELKEMGVELPYPYIGSNAFAIAPSQSADGSTIHFGGPQTPFGNSQPEIHLEWPGGRVAGYGYGLMVDPGIGLHHAWGSTANWPDTSDAWRLRLDPEREGYYWNPAANGGGGAWDQMRLMMFTVKVSGESPRQYRRWETDLGPVLWIDQKVRNDVVEAAYAYVWRPSCWGRIEYLDAAMRRQWAGSLKEAMGAADPPEIVSGNWIMADQKGNIGFMYNARIPGRKDRRASLRVKDWNGIDGWAGWFYGLTGKGVLPSILNPASGFLVSSNEAPWHVTTSGEVPGREAWPEYVVPADGWGSGPTGRGARLRELIAAKKLRPEEAGALPFDAKAVKAWEFVRRAVEKYTASSEKITFSPRAAEVHQILSEWDGMATVDSVGMTAAFFLMRELLPWGDTAEAELMDRAMVECEPSKYAAAVETVSSRLHSKYGKTAVPWGEIHGMAVNGQWIPLPGGTDYLAAVFQAHAGSDHQLDVLGGDGRIRCADGSVHLAFTRFARDGKIERYTVSPAGQHNAEIYPDSPHCSDQAALYAAGRYRKFCLDEDEIQANLTPYEGRDGYPLKGRKELLVEGLEAGVGSQSQPTVGSE